MLIRASNFLIGKGKAKAIALMDEFSHLESALVGHLPLFWIVRTTFTSTAPGGVFELPFIGAISPSPPANLATWPTFPIQIVDDVPLSFFQGVTLGGVPESFEWYAKSNAASWKPRTRPLVPADDPFASYSGIGMPGWHYPPEAGKRAAGRNQDRADALAQLLLLVRTAYRPMGDVKDYDRCHREFLRGHSHWDKARQKYVRQTAG